MKSEEKAAVEPPVKKQKTAEGTVKIHVMQCVVFCASHSVGTYFKDSILELKYRDLSLKCI